ncbi:MAG: metallophosphoesterase family protein [Planctomycetota bacterium]|jgi:DNA repair exonuclease SbcCD nuclease subunit
MTTRLLCIGDIHLGRRPSRIGDGLGLRPEELTPEVAWSAAIDVAIERRVHAVLLAGDVVERVEDRFRAFAALEQGVRRLQQAGIRALAVVGNHDVEALPLLAERGAGVELLGVGEQRWEKVRIHGDEGAEVDLWGWSFRQKVEPANPIDSFPSADARDGNIPTLGLLHTDLDAGESRHAPTRRSDLESTGLDAWLLGHIHRPSPLAVDDPVGYLGSLSALDPGEPGAHGPWEVTVQTDGSVHFEHIPLAPLRYDGLTLDAGALPEEGDLAHALAIELERRVVPEWIREHSHDLERVQAIALRVTLIGETSRGPALRRAAEELRGQRLNLNTPTVFVETFLDATRPALDLVSLARDTGYRGLIARRLLGLERGDALGQRVLADARERVERELAEHAPWRELDENATHLPDEQLRARLISGARRTLEALELQRSGGNA